MDDNDAQARRTRALMERLRKASVYEEYKAILSNLGDEAADTIEAQSAEIERLRAKEKGWAEVFDAQKSVIGRLTDTLHEIKRCNAHYNFGSKLVRLVDAALEKLP